MAITRVSSHVAAASSMSVAIPLTIDSLDPAEMAVLGTTDSTDRIKIPSSIWWHHQQRFPGKVHNVHSLTLMNDRIFSTRKELIITAYLWKNESGSTGLLRRILSEKGSMEDILLHWFSYAVRCLQIVWMLYDRFILVRQISCISMLHCMTKSATNPRGSYSYMKTRKTFRFFRTTSVVLTTNHLNVIVVESEYVSDVTPGRRSQVPSFSRCSHWLVADVVSARHSSGLFDFFFFLTERLHGWFELFSRNLLRGFLALYTC